EKGRGWHAFRRNFASELRHAGLRDLCDLGGWKDPMTVVKRYQRPSEEAMRAAQAAQSAGRLTQRTPERAPTGGNWKKRRPRVVSQDQAGRSLVPNRGARIRTGDLLLPKQAR